MPPKHEASTIPEHASTHAEYAFKMPKSSVFEKLEAAALPEYPLKAPKQRSTAKLKAMIFPDYASKMPGWVVFCEACGLVAGACLQDARLGSSWAAEGHDHVRVCLQDARIVIFGNSRP